MEMHKLCQYAVYCKVPLRSRLCLLFTGGSAMHLSAVFWPTTFFLASPFSFGRRKTLHPQGHEATNLLHLVKTANLLQLHHTSRVPHMMWATSAWCALRSQTLALKLKRLPTVRVSTMSTFSLLCFTSPFATWPKTNMHHTLHVIPIHLSSTF